MTIYKEKFVKDLRSMSGKDELLDPKLKLFRHRKKNPYSSTEKERRQAKLQDG